MDSQDAGEFCHELAIVATVWATLPKKTKIEILELVTNASATLGHGSWTPTKISVQGLKVTGLRNCLRLETHR
ncbi:MAG: hypothetical protein M2R45_04901 [Verrucomicrobia subdivision 3 bacterium]|nr:hypothetical protein [Limisphaerales bacterium]MCS1417554.1 hypothetical protein [Limisphaerales bacterium]